MVDKELSDFMPKANSDGELVVGELLSDISTPIEKKLIIDQLTKINDLIRKSLIFGDFRSA